MKDKTNQYLYKIVDKCSMLLYILNKICAKRLEEFCRMKDIRNHIHRMQKQITCTNCSKTSTSFPTLEGRTRENEGAGNKLHLGKLHILDMFFHSVQSVYGQFIPRYWSLLMLSVLIVWMHSRTIDTTVILYK